MLVFAVNEIVGEIAVYRVSNSGLFIYVRSKDFSLGLLPAASIRVGFSISCGMVPLVSLVSLVSLFLFILAPGLD